MPVGNLDSGFEPFSAIRAHIDLVLPPTEWNQVESQPGFALEGAILYSRNSCLYCSSYPILVVISIGLICFLFGGVDGWCQSNDAIALVNGDTQHVITPQPMEMAVEVVRTQSYEVHLSSIGGLPIRWELVDQTVVGSNLGPFGAVPIIDLVSRTQAIGKEGRPLELMLATEDGDVHDWLTYASHELSREDEGGTTVVRWQSPDHPSGLKVTRIYRIPHEGFEAELLLTLSNTGTERLVFDHEGRGPAVALGPGLGSPPTPPVGVGGGLFSYVRPVLRTSGGVEDVKLDGQETPVEIAGVIRWGGVHRRYFLAALYGKGATTKDQGLVTSTSWLPPRHAGESMKSDGELRHFPIVALHFPPVVLEPGDEFVLDLGLYFGPKDRRLLAANSQRLDDVLFPALWNWMRWLCFAIMWVLDIIHALIPSWGLSIIALAILIRLIMLPVAQVGLKHQATMAAQQAVFNRRMAEVNEKFKDDPQQKSQESWKVFKEDGVGPLSTLKGCSWLIIQIPIFIALFNLLGQSFALRGASFLWIADLAEPDRLFALGFDIPVLGGYLNILPIFMAASQVFVSNLSSNPQADAKEKMRQKRFMFVLAIVFMVLFYSFPSGLVLYWMTSNLGQLLQQWLVGRGSKEIVCA